MTTEKAIEFGKIFLKSIEDEKGSATYEFVETAVKMMEQQPILDKIRAEIADLDDADYDYEGYYKAVTDAVKIIDKYKADRSDEV